jgi:hypothetical protein
MQSSSSSSNPFSRAAFAFSSGDLLYPIFCTPSYVYFLYPQIGDPNAAKIKENWIERLHLDSAEIGNCTSR